MKLIDSQKLGKVEVEFKEGEAIFSNPFLDQMMRETGVIIPHYLQAHYNGRKVIKKNDPGFQKAFKEIYYVRMDTARFKWED